VRVRAGQLKMPDFLAGLGGHGYGVFLVCTSMPLEIAERGLHFPGSRARDQAARDFWDAERFSMQRPTADAVSVCGEANEETKP
jgi:hypothetical protein